MKSWLQKPFLNGMLALFFLLAGVVLLVLFLTEKADPERNAFKEIGRLTLCFVFGAMQLATWVQTRKHKNKIDQRDRYTN